jgi:hypothetical protein
LIRCLSNDIKEEKQDPDIIWKCVRQQQEQEQRQEQERHRGREHSTLATNGEFFFYPAAIQHKQSSQFSSRFALHDSHSLFTHEPSNLQSNISLKPNQQTPAKSQQVLNIDPPSPQRKNQKKKKGSTLEYLSPAIKTPVFSSPSLFGFLLKMKERDIKCVTGLPSEAVVDLCNRYETARYSYKKRINFRGSPFAFSASDEIIVHLFHLKQYTSIEVLVLLLSCFSQSYVDEKTIRNINERTGDWMYRLVSQSIKFGNLAWRLQRAKKLWNYLVTFCVDGSEQEVFSPEDPLMEALFFSPKKGKHTIVLVAIVSLDGYVMYISPSFPGCSHDPIILESASSVDNWHTNFRNFEWGLGDTIFSQLYNKGYHIINSEGNCGEWNRYHSHLRIIVEQLFGWLKTFNILNARLRILPSAYQRLLIEHNKNWVKVAGLHNLYIWPSRKENKEE